MEKLTSTTLSRSAVAVALTGSFLLTACSTEETPESKAPASSSPASSPTTAAPSTPAPDPTEQTKTELTGLYRSYWAEMEKAYQLGSTKETRLSDYAAAVALAEAEKNVTTHSTAGRTTSGSVGVNDTTVTKLDLNQKMASATLSTCLDISRWNLINKATKKKIDLPSERLTRYVIVTTLEKWPQGWRIVLDEPQEQTC
ncbi:hypothetical protein [Streptomyces roseolus]|uniref:hypothetical protein n=1 Tax=Streptomyces roseolus TaxID=67358 RepID=UPI00167B10D3|nr:hypothetical protein [Streptomyces roseolus]GGR67721.1 hypothetical protein GCM10010282_70760 [Streptomyces roseolus]